MSSIRWLGDNLMMTDKTRESSSSREEDSSNGQEEEKEMSYTGSHPKSYVSMLDEFCSQQKLTPTYLLLTVEGMSHEPTFVYRVQVDGYEPALGKGRRKQDARQLAAKHLLQAMSLIKSPPQSSFSSTNDHHQDEQPASSSSFPSSITPPSQSEEDDPGGRKREEKNVEMRDGCGVLTVYPIPGCRLDNPVGSLQELTLSIRWPPPRFDLHFRQGAAHEATFTMACFVWSYLAFGKGKSKKMAKRLAAHNMYQILSTSSEVMELWQKRAEMYAAKTAHQRRQKHGAIPGRGAAMQDMHKDLWTSQTHCTLRTLRQSSPHTILTTMSDPLAFLREIATEVAFDILFEDLYDLDKGGKSAPPRATSRPAPPAPLQDSQEGSRPLPANIADKSANAASLIILTLPRQIVCFGSGVSKTAARRAAVLNALLYLHTAATPPPST